MLIASDVAQELKEKGDAVDYKLETMISKINVHTNQIEVELNGNIKNARESFKSDLKRTVDTLKEENTKVFTLLDEIKARLALQDA